MGSCFKAKTSSTLPDWIKTPTKAISAAVMPEINKPFVAYDKPMVAGMSDTSTDAMAQLRALLGEGGTGMTLPRLIDDIPGAPGTPGGSTQDYMDPYLEEVLAPILRNINVGRQQANMSNDAAANMAGAFGDTGHGLERAETNERAITAGGDATAKAYSDAFRAAMGMKGEDINRMGTAKSQSAQILDRLFGMGQAEQETAQKGMNADFSEFMREQGFTTEQIAKIASIVGSMQAGGTTTTPSTASSVLGAASGVGSIIAKL